MTIDKAQLKALAEAAMHPQRTIHDEHDLLYRFQHACYPAEILALLTEIERLEDGEQVADELCAQLSGLLDQIATIVRGPALPGQRHGYGDLPSRVKTVIAERNTLRAELAGLRTGYDAQNAVIAELRKDAVRYRWLRDPDNQCAVEDDSDYYMPPMICGYAEHEEILTHEALDKAIDAAMAGEASQ